MLTIIENMLVPKTQIAHNFFDNGFAILRSNSVLQEILSKISNDFVQLANSHFDDQGLDIVFPDLPTLREYLTNGESQYQSAYKYFLKDVLRSGHNSISRINKELLPICYELSKEFGINENTNQGIIRFRISTPSESIFDHYWHQDSIDAQNTPRNERNFKLGFWMPLHDVGIDEGSMEFAKKSHFSSLPHTNSDSLGRLYFEDNLVSKYEKHEVSTLFSEFLAFDSWVAHRTLPNISKRTRFSILIWL